MAVPAHRATGTTVFAPNNIANPTALAPTKSGSTVNGDLMVLWTWCRSITATVGAITGWNVVTGFPKTSGTASGGRVYCLTRIADGGANDAPTVTWTGVTTGTSGDASGAVIESVSNAVETLDVSAVASSDLAAQTNTSTIPDVTTLHDQAIGMGFAMKLLESAGQTSTVTNYTERVDSTTTSGTGHVVTVGTVVKATAGALGTGTVTWSAATSARALAVSLAFRNAPTTVSLGVVTETDTSLDSEYPDAQPQFIGSSSAEGSLSATPVAPTAMLVGDLLFMSYRGYRGAPHSISITGGANGTWATLDDFSDGAITTSNRGAMFAKVAEAGDIGATFTVDGPNVNVALNLVVAGLVAIRVGRAQTYLQAIDATATSTETATNSPHTLTGVTSAFANELIMALVASVGNAVTGPRSAWAATDPAALTERLDFNTNATGDGGVAAATAVRSAAGATGTISWNTVAATQDILKMAIALKGIPFIDKTLALTVVTQASTAVAQSFNKALTLTTAAETDSAIALSYGLVATDIERSLTAITESNSAIALSFAKALTLTPAGETTTATAETVQKTLSVSTATETDTAQAVTGYKAVTISTATETDSTVAITFTKTILKDVTTATESDSATAQTASKAVDITTASETDSAQAVTFYRTVDLTPVSEADTAVAVTGYKTVDITPTGEADAAQALTFTKDIHKDVTQVTETDFATTLSIAGGPIPIDPVFETDTPVALVFTKDILVSLTPVDTTDTAQALTAAKEYTLGVIAETDTAVPLSTAQDIIRSLTTVTETDEAVALTVSGPFENTEAADEGHATDGVRSGGVAYPKRGMVF